jgi:hypothetical protein
MTEAKRAPETAPATSNRQKKFLKRALQALGYKTYRAYLRSAWWKELGDRYRASSQPQVCIVCYDPNVDLHHKTYKRLGQENLSDLLPLCRQHHEESHALEQTWRRRGQDQFTINLWTAARILHQQYRHPLPEAVLDAPLSATCS